VKIAILKTLAYADIFDYPLTRPEIYRWAIGKFSTSSLPRQLYFFLPHRQHLVAIRYRRHRASLVKLKLARKVGEWLKLIPTIKLVAVTGALAMNNSDQPDDIDLMIVTAPHTLWLTRPLVILFLEIFGLRRRPTSRYNLVANRFCLNLWLDTTSLSVPKPYRNLYTAHEVSQVKPLWDRGDTYHQFLFANSWINHYLPNITLPKVKKLIPGYWSLIGLLNQLAFRLQLWYMRPHLTRERVSLHAAFFHPRDTAKQVMRQYRHRLIRLNLKP